MDGCPRQNPAYRPANGKPRKCGVFPSWPARHNDEAHDRLGGTGGRASLHLRDQHLGLARRVGTPHRYQRRPRRGARGGVGHDRGARVRRRLADGRLGAQPGRDRDRAPERWARGELPASAAGFRRFGRGRLAVLHPRLHGRRGARRDGRPGCGARGTRTAWSPAAPRLRAESRRARSRVDGGAPGVLRRWERG